MAIETLERTPVLESVLPGQTWEERHSPATFTYAAHQAFFAGFLPTPARPGPHPRRFALRFAGSETTTPDTEVFDAPDLISGFAARGYHTRCVSGVGFFNLQNPLGNVLPGLFAERHWRPELGVTEPRSTQFQVEQVTSSLAQLPAERRCFTFLNVAALHQPNRFYVQYQYGYPHKTAYRFLPEPRSLASVWRSEDQSALSLYLHIPFCEMRCGFCNLFTIAGPLEPVMERFVATLEREAAVVRRALPNARFSRITVGGGTPSLLPVPLLYRQISMRCFRAAHAPAPFGPAYRCQDDGMVGLGVGARSYTNTLHYSSEWAVSPRAVRGIIDAYCERDDASFSLVHHGIELDEAEQRRRHLILSLLAEGLDAAVYRQKFERDAAADFPELQQLVDAGLAVKDDAGWNLTAGVERSDAIGPWLQSSKVTSMMKAYEVR